MLSLQTIFILNSIYWTKGKQTLVSFKQGEIYYFLLWTSVKKGNGFTQERMAPHGREQHTGQLSLCSLLSYLSCMVVDDLLPSLSVAKNRTRQLVVWWSGVRWSYWPCPWWISSFVWVSVCGIGKLFLRDTLANKFISRSKLVSKILQGEDGEGGPWLESL